MGVGASASLNEASGADIKKAIANLSAANREKVAKALSSVEIKPHELPIPPQIFLWPPTPFNTDDAPPAPDYSDLATWASHPDKENDVGNDFVPPGENPPPPRNERPADCFWVHSSHSGSRHDMWNAWVGDPCLDEWTTVGAASSAGSLNVSCRIFYPMYRSTGGASHMHLHHPKKECREGAPEACWKDAQAAMDLAYSDVDRAFDVFLKQTGDRPIVIASESQGSMHAQRLMERFEKDEVLRKRLVCAYILGPVSTFPMDKFERNFPSLKPCSGPLDSGCVIAYDNVSEDHPVLGEVGKQTHLNPMSNKGTDPRHLARYVGSNGEGVWESVKDKKMYCVNPLTWSSDTARAEASLHLGMLLVDYVQADGKTPTVHKRVQIKDMIVDGKWKMDAGGEYHKVQGIQIVNARKVEVGKLWTEIIHEGGALLQAKCGLGAREHSVWCDFWFNIRENCKQRVAAFKMA